MVSIGHCYNFHMVIFRTKIYHSTENSYQLCILFSHYFLTKFRHKILYDYEITSEDDN